MSSENQRLLGQPNNDPTTGSSSRYLGNQTSSAGSVHDGSEHVPGEFVVESGTDIEQNYLKAANYTSFNHQSKVFLNLVLFLNTLWLIFTFISDFFFEMNFVFKHSNRIASFVDINLITVAIIANFLSLWFNYMEFYSVIDEKLNFINSMIILFNFGLYLLVGYNRKRLGTIGKLTFLWCFASFFISGFIDYQLSSYIKPLLGLYDDNAEQDESIRVLGPNPTEQSVVVDAQVDSDEPEPTLTQSQRSTNATLNRIAQDQQKVKKSHAQVGIRHTLTEWTMIFMRNGLKSLLMIWLVFFTLNNILYSIDVSRIVNHMDIKTKPQENSQLVSSDSISTDFSTTVDGFFWNDLKDPSYQMHVTCYGNLSDSRTPLVVYEHGSMDTAYSSANWMKELHNFGKLDRFCFYERPGFGLSDSAPSPVSIGIITESFKDILIKQILPAFTTSKTEITVVGYDIGGLYAQVLCAKLSQCTKLMLVESWHEDLLTYKTWLPSNDSFNSKSLRELGKWNNFKTWLFGVFESSLGLRLMKSFIVNKSGSLDRISGDFMIYQGKYLRSRFQESLTSGLLSYNDVVESRKLFFNRVELSVVSSKEMIRKNAQWGDWQRSFAKLSKSTREWEIVDSGHYLYDTVNGKKSLQDVLYRLVFE